MTRHEDQDTRRSQILHAARTTLVERGHENTRMDDIARYAQLSKGGIYFHFPSKRAVLLALLEEEYLQAIDMMTAAVSARGAALGRLRRLGAAYLERFSQDQERSRLILIFANLSLHDPEIALRMQQMHQAFLSALTGLLRDAVDAGELHIKDPGSAAVLLKAMIDGLEASSAVGVQQEIGPLLTEAMRWLKQGVLSP